MTKFFNLDFHGTRFTVPKPNLFYLFEHRRDLFDATIYEVQSSVPLGIFEVFVEALGTGAKIRITKENAGAISLLAKEFWLEDLFSECSALQINSTPELIAALSERISKLEHRLSSQPLSIAEFKESIANHERRLQSLDCRISELGRNHSTDLKGLKSGSSTPVRPVCASKSRKKIVFPLNDDESLDGIISYLTRKHGGNVHNKGIVTITPKSVYSDDRKVAPRNITDFTSDSWFYSANAPGQWICCDFREMLVRPTHYTIKSQYLKSWTVESSLDGEAWTEIDRRTDSDDFRTASFAVSKSAECRFIRLTQIAKNHGSTDFLTISALEFFGTLLE
jgi:hypothetical protein